MESSNWHVKMQWWAKMEEEGSQERHKRHSWVRKAPRKNIFLHTIPGTEILKEDNWVEPTFNVGFFVQDESLMNHCRYKIPLCFHVKYVTINTLCEWSTDFWGEICNKNTFPLSWHRNDSGQIGFFLWNDLFNGTEHVGRRPESYSKAIRKYSTH